MKTARYAAPSVRGQLRLPTSSEATLSFGIAIRSPWFRSPITLSSVTCPCRQVYRLMTRLDQPRVGGKVADYAGRKWRWPPIPTAAKERQAQHDEYLLSVWHPDTPHVSCESRGRRHAARNRAVYERLRGDHAVEHIPARITGAGMPP